LAGGILPRNAFSDQFTLRRSPIPSSRHGRRPHPADGSGDFDLLRVSGASNHCDADDTCSHRAELLCIGS
jgi:hypothetical protein